MAKSIPCRGKSKCKGPGIEVDTACSRTNNVACVIEADGTVERDSSGVAGVAKDQIS